MKLDLTLTWVAAGGTREIGGGITDHAEHIAESP